MKKLTHISFVVMLGFTIAYPTKNVSAFTSDLYFGMENNNEVILLQQFLTEKGFYTGPITGNFYELTEAAVKRFQSAAGVPATGYFGPLSRGQALLSGSIESSLSVIYPGNGEVLATGSTETVQWESSSYPTNGKVNINLIKQISTNPNQYSLVRVVNSHTDNDGSETWTPLAHETGDNYFIEVTCATESTSGCRAGVSSQSFAMINTDTNRNLANPLSTFEDIIDFLRERLN